MKNYMLGISLNMRMLVGKSIGIETKTGNSRRKLVAAKIGRANAVRSDVVMVRLTLTRGEFSDSDSIFVEREKDVQSGFDYGTSGVKMENTSHSYRRWQNYDR